MLTSDTASGECERAFLLGQIVARCLFEVCGVCERALCSDVDLVGGAKVWLVLRSSAKDHCTVP